MKRSLRLKLGTEYRVLSLHPPWAWAIVHAGKDIENRSWTTPFRGTFLIHASAKVFGKRVTEEYREHIAELSGLPLSKIPDTFPQSQIIGAVDLVDCVSKSTSKWAIRGNKYWYLANPQPIAVPIANVTGKLNLWRWTFEGR